MLSMYPACFFKEPSGYSVVFPDLNWLSTCGRTLEEALAMSVDCLAGYLYTCKKEEIPSPSPSNQIDPCSIAKELDIESDYEEAFVNIITVDVQEYARTHFARSVKKTLTIPQWLNDAAVAANLNFSQILQDALKVQLGFTR